MFAGTMLPRPSALLAESPGLGTEILLWLSLIIGLLVINMIIKAAFPGHQPQSLGSPHSKNNEIEAGLHEIGSSTCHPQDFLASRAKPGSGYYPTKTAVDRVSHAPKS
jgi:hypothetical protein